MNGIAGSSVNDSASLFNDEVLAHQIALGFINYVDPCLLLFKIKSLAGESALVEFSFLLSIGLDCDDLGSHSDSSFIVIKGSGIYPLKASKVKPCGR